MNHPAIFWLLAALLPLLAACGTKGWPAPRPGDDTLALQNAVAGGFGPCLTLRAEVAGDLETLAGVTLLLEEDPCPGCPFSPRLRQDLGLGDERLRLEGNRLSLSYCGLRPGVGHRWRAVVNSRLPGVVGGSTPILSTPATPPPADPAVHGTNPSADQP